MARWQLGLMVCFCCSAFCLAQSSSIDESRVRQLVQQLESRERVERDRAAAQLRELGSGVLPLLPEIDSRTSGVLKQQLLRLRDHLEQARVSESAQASRVTLHGTMTLSDAFARIEEQTGNSILDYRGQLNQTSDNAEISVDFDQTLFWPALDQIMDQTGLTVYPYVGEPRKLAVVAAPDAAAARYDRCAYEGLFRIEATAITLERNLRTPGSDTLRMSLEYIWEPRVLPILVRQDLDDIQFTTDNGETLAAAVTGTTERPVLPGNAAIDVALPLELPSRDAKQIASLKGRFTALVPGGDVTFEFTDLTAQNVQQRKGGMTVVLDRVRRNGGVQQVYVRLRLDQATDALQSHLDWVENNVVRLLDPEGNPADEPNYEKYLERDSEVGYSYIFPVEEDLKGWKFVYTTPAGIAEIAVDYELKNIALP